ncbi:MAG TPA: triose-phosphate isomerase [Chloroflexota bacterium]|nr:triose-phosphate isomerase [Chloroflexota bacterium]
MSERTYYRFVPARNRLVAGNWKMNCTAGEARALAEDIVAALPPGSAADVVVCPPFTALSAVRPLLEGSQVALGAQNMYFEQKGAFTGEISPLMLLDAGCRYVILGHSERRRQMGEASEQVNRKLKLALATGLTPIVCVGETWPERSAGQTEQVIREQVTESFADVPPEAFASLLIAYEPVWAIGTGQVATPEQAAEVHRYVRGLLPPEVAAKVRILYGGSVTPENCRGLMASQELDGALVGGASLKAESFVAIVQAAA